MSFFDPLHLSIALGPLAVYLLLLGLIHVTRRPFVTTGTRDAATLGVAISGLLIVGPMDLFLPEATANRFGGYAWLLLLSLYALSLTFLVLLLRPRIVIYNITADQLRPVLGETISGLDREARWAGESVVLPQLGVQLHVETARTFRTAQLVSSGPRQDYVGWRKLELALAQNLRRSHGRRHWCGFVFLSVAILAASWITFSVTVYRDRMVQSLWDMLRL